MVITYSPEPMDYVTSTELPMNGVYINGNNHSFDHCPTHNQENHCGTFLFINHFIFMGIMCLIGACGHILTIATLFYDSKRNVTSFLLLMLAVTETVFLVTTVLTRCIPVLCAYTEAESVCHFRYYSWPYIVKYAIPFSVSMLVSSVWIVVLVTIHRTVAVLVPHRAKEFATINSVRKQCVTLIICAFIYNIPRFFELVITPRKNCSPLLSFAPFVRNEFYNIFYKNVLMNIFVNIGPLLLLTILTWCLIREIHITIRRRQILSHRIPNTSSRTSLQLTILLVLLVVVFIVCQIPHTIYALLRALVPSSSFKCPNTMYYFLNISDALVVFNSSINFFLYCLAGKRFRQHLRELCWSPKSSQRGRPKPSVSSGRTGFSTPLTMLITQ